MTESVPVVDNSRVKAPASRLFVLALLSAIVVSTLLCVAALGRGDGISALEYPGETGPSAAVFHHDFPHARLAKGPGEDGQQFYAIARQPMHLKAIAPALDRPRYRLQRILLPVLAWILQPQGGGPGLAIALYAVAALGAVAVGFGGALSLDALGAPATTTERAALLLPVLPGVLASVNLATPDALATGLALIAIALDQRGRRRWAVPAGVLAVLAKESVLLVLLGWALWRGVRAAWLVAIPAAAAGAWWLVLRFTFAHTPEAVHEFQPILGLVHSAHHWTSSTAGVAAGAALIATLGLGVVALARRGIRSPFGPAIAIQIAFLLCLAPDVIGLYWNNTRAALPLMALAGLALAAPAQPTHVPSPITRQHA